ncbi:hypothetical protein [Priestia taiwanensis]|uniref:Uncharacterized protein n=1 Tax=Priestia taiwanensis TaxID=1347902 RepID=A0A917EMR7_9BACI|nr:hypothetical protein [Priestia taiwanensis]MBM7361909.1 hypothetical protein [Priestia taiwanensis]GGE57933.1 hypothetical protein GCM10007140_05370 [Priestia taiwanensis]
MDIHEYMTPTEAAFRWGLDPDLVAQHLQDEEIMSPYLSKGWAKSFRHPSYGTKEWIITEHVMLDLHGTAPSNECEAP